MASQQLINVIEARDTDICSNSVQLSSSNGDVFLVDIDELKDKSDYFKCLFASGMKETRQQKLEFPLLDSKCLEMAVKYMSGNTLLDLEDVKHLIIAANYFQMKDAIKSCVDYLNKNITVNTCCSMLELANELMISEVVEVSYRHITSHFEEFSLAEDFLSFEHNQAVQLLSSDDLHVKDEMIVFEAAVRWLNNRQKTQNSPNGKDKDHDEQHSLMKCVRFGLLTAQQRVICEDTLSKFPDAVMQVMSSVDCFDENPRKLHINGSQLYKMRKGSSMETIILTGGFTNKSEASTNRVQLMSSSDLYPPKTMSQNKQSVYRFSVSNQLRLPEPLCEHSTCVLDNYLYVAGGQRSYRVDGRSTQNTVWRFNPRTCSWLEVSSMLRPRSLFCLLEVAGHMYAVCGLLVPGRVNKSVEKYDPEEDTWTYVAPIEIGLHEHAGCSYNGSLYASGGYKGPARGHLDQLWKYDPVADKWSLQCPMYRARSYHSMVALDDKQLLVAGGVCFIGEQSFIDVQDCELYDIANNQWTTLAPMPLPASCMPCLLHSGRLYLFGGHKFHGGNDKHNSVQVLDLENWTWTVNKMDTSGILFSAVNVLSFQSSWLRHALKC